MKNQLLFEAPRICTDFRPDERVVLHHGDALEFLKTLPSHLASLIITSPPYNLGKEYERKRALEKYLEEQSTVIKELFRVLRDDGSICWQVGNFVDEGEVFPLDIHFYPVFKELGGRLRNRIIWQFGHGLHASKRFSGRYETILWFSKTDDYIFNLDAVRVPSKYPGKTHFKGPKRGLPSGNPLGKNPSDVWQVLQEDWDSAVWNIPNVKANHPEKTIHPCQFPVELVERCVLALTNEDGWVLDPFAGVGSSLIACIKNNRRAIGCEKESEYLEMAKDRLESFFAGKLRIRKMGTPVFEPTGNEKITQRPVQWDVREKGSSR
jgi:adenine-specific DNA-methyltransferase